LISTCRIAGLVDAFAEETVDFEFVVRTCLEGCRLVGKRCWVSGLRAGIRGKVSGTGVWGLDSAFQDFSAEECLEIGSSGHGRSWDE